MVHFLLPLSQCETNAAVDLNLLRQLGQTALPPTWALLLGCSWNSLGVAYLPPHLAPGQTNALMRESKYFHGSRFDPGETVAEMVRIRALGLLFDGPAAGMD